jgi:hypothetical protein
LDVGIEINVWLLAKFVYAFGLVMRPMVQLSAITLEKLQAFSDRSSTLVTIDAPLFGSVMIMNGRLLYKAANYVEPAKIGQSIGFPAYEQIVAEASRFWIQHETGVRMRKGRDEMAKLLEDI